MRKLSFIGILLLCLLILGCGSGGSGSNSNGNKTNNITEANAGADQIVTIGNLVKLDGIKSTGANGSMITYSWSFSLKPDGSNATLSNPSIVNPTFTADVAGTYKLNLVVNDGTVNSAPSIVTIVASVLNVAPVANAEGPQNVATGIIVTLDGSKSYDANGDALTYSWSFTSMPDGSSATLFSSGLSPVITFFTPDVEGTYNISLIVSDGKLNSTSATITVNAKQPTVVNGILSSDTTLNKASSPYLINLQIPDGITLTIEPGVSLYGDGLTVWGTLNAIGTDVNRIQFNNVYIESGFKATDSRLNISFADIMISNKSSFSNGYASITITDSVIKTNGNYIQISFSKHDSNIERNTLINTSITIGAIASPVYITNNNFIGSSKVFFWCSNSPVNVQYNSFLTSSTEVIRLPDYCDVSNMEVSSNFWGTTDINKIESMIMDHRRYYGITVTVDYMPILNEADPDTPDPTLYLE